MVVNNFINIAQHIWVFKEKNLQYYNAKAYIENENNAYSQY